MTNYFDQMLFILTNFLNLKIIGGMLHPHYTHTHTHPVATCLCQEYQIISCCKKSNARPLKPFVKTMYKIIHALNKLYVLYIVQYKLYIVLLQKFPICRRRSLDLMEIKLSGTLIVHKSHSKFALFEFKMRFKPYNFVSKPFLKWF